MTRYFQTLIFCIIFRKKKAASDVSFARVQKTISNHRSKNKRSSGLKGEEFESIYDLGKRLEADPSALKMDNNETLKFKLLTSSSKSHHIIFYDEKLLKEFKGETDIQADGTFRIKPAIKGVQQFFTIMARKNGAVSKIKDF